MAALSTIIAGVGLGIGAAGTVAQVAGQRKSSAAAERAERLRETQMNIENARQQRQIARQVTVARAQAVSNAAMQGAQESSGLAGGYGQIQGQAGSASVASNQNTQIGAGIFSANAQMSQGNTLASIGSGISSLGGALVNNSQTLGRIGNYAFGVRGV